MSASGNTRTSDRGAINERMQQAIEAVRARAVELLTPECFMAVATDATTLGRHHTKPTGLLAIAIPTASVVLAIDMKEWPAVMAFAAGEVGHHALQRELNKWQKQVAG